MHHDLEPEDLALNVPALLADVEDRVTHCRTALPPLADSPRTIASLCRLVLDGRERARELLERNVREQAIALDLLERQRNPPCAWEGC